MKTKAVQSTPPTEATILARILSNGEDPIPADIARYLLTVGFSDSEKARIHDLTVRNQADALSTVEKEELFAYIRAGTVLGILQSKSRRTLKVKPKKTPTS